MTIRSFLAFLMLVIFTFGITPKRYLHSIFAGHHDISVSSTPSSSDENAGITQGGFNCDCNNQVATSPFTDQDDTPVSTAVHVYLSYSVSPPVAVFSSSQFSLGLRGPPAIG